MVGGLSKFALALPLKYSRELDELGQGATYIRPRQTSLERRDSPPFHFDQKFDTLAYRGDTFGASQDFFVMDASESLGDL